MKGCLAGFLLAAMLSVSAAEQTPDRGELKRRAKAGDVVAMRELARDYQYGIDGWRSRRKAERWAREAAYAGDRPAQLLLGRILARDDRGWLGDAACFWTLAAANQGEEEAYLHAGDCVAAGRSPDGIAEARAWYERVLAKEERLVARRLYVMYSAPRWIRDAQVRRHHEEEARRWLIRAAEVGDVDSMKQLADQLREGKQGPKDIAAAARWYRQAAELGDVEAGAEYGALLQSAAEVLDPAAAVIVLRRAADKGSVRASRLLGDAYARSLGVTRDASEAQRWYLAAARENEREAAYQRALHHLDPLGGEYSHRRARYWLEKATRAGHAAAGHRLGYLYLRGEGVDPDAKRGIRWLQYASGNNYVPAAQDLGKFYLQGRVVKRDVDAALTIYNRIEKHTDATTRYTLARALLDGEGVRRDENVGRHWLKLAAEAGHAQAQYEVAGVFENGYGEPPDSAAALRWYRAAAEQGLSAAMYAYAAALADGRGAKPDPGAADAWFAKARATGTPEPPRAHRAPSGEAVYAAARAQGRSIANLAWHVDMARGGLERLEVRDLSPVGMLRAEFSLESPAYKTAVDAVVAVGVEAEEGDRVELSLRVPPSPDPEDTRAPRDYELVLERREKGAVRERRKLASGRWPNGWHWVEITWNATGDVQVKLRDGRTEMMRLGTGPARLARAEIQSGAGRFRYLTVE